MSLRDLGRSIVSFLRRHIHRPRVEISRVNVIAAVALIVISIISIMIRLLPTLGFETLVRAFDPWYNYRETKFILENGFGAWFGWYDWSTWVPFGRNIPRTSYPGIPFTAAFLYLAVQAVGIQVDLMVICVLFPAIMGTLGVIATFFLGREVASKEVGLFAAFFMAIIPAYTQRTIAGFFDNEAIGILAIILTLLFFSRALRKGSIVSSILGGLSLGYLSASWSVYLYIFQVLAIFALVLVLLRRYSRRLLLAYSGTILGGMLIAVCVPRIGPDWVQSSTGLIPIGVFGLLFLIEFSRMLRVSEWSFPASFSQISVRLRPYFAYIFGSMCALIVVSLGYLFQSGLILQLSTGLEISPYLGLASKFQTVLDPLIRQNAFLLASVGEHLPAPWATYWYNIIFLVLVMPFGFYMAFRREREIDMLLIIFALTALYFSGSMIRLALLLAPAAAIVGAYGISMALRPFRPIFWQRPILTRRRRRITPSTTRGFASVVYIFMIILLLASTYYAVDSVNLMGSPEITPGYRDEATGSSTDFRSYLETFSWARHHTPEGSIFISWWDYGYWIRELADRPVVVDNATNNKTQIGWVGRMLMETDPIEALKIARRFNASYVLIHFGYAFNLFSGDEGKWQWMARISGEVFGDEVPPESYFWSDPLKGGNGSYFQPYFNTLIYNMLWANVSEDYAQSRPGPAVDLNVDPALTIFKIFPPAYTSQVPAQLPGLMKIYAVNYTWLDSSIDIGGASAYAVNWDIDPVYDLSSVVLEVTNTGKHAYEVDSATIDYWDERDQRYETDYFPQIWLTSNTGDFWIEPNETMTINIRAQPVFKVGTTVNVTVNAGGFTPALNTTVTIPVQHAPAYDVSPVLVNSHAYDNGTVVIELENTGEGFVEIDKEIRILDTQMSVVGRSDRGRLLFTGERITFTIDTLEQGIGTFPAVNDTVPVTIYYMSNIPTYTGFNTTFSLTVEATPSPPSLPSVEQSQVEYDEQKFDAIPKIAPTDSLNLFYSEPLCCSDSACFIARRYRP